MATVSLQWTEKDLITLLCTLNFRIEEIRSTTKKDPKKGLRYASEIISEEIGNGCTSSRAERKMWQLWTSCGNPDGNKEPYDICLHGAFPKTLPGIESELFLKVAHRVDEMQRHAEASKTPENRPVLASVRRSRRKATSSRKEDLVVCRCGFTHNILWVRCDRCATAQHAYCYYDTEDETMLPDSHLCDECKLNDEAVLGQNLAQLRIQLEKVGERRRRELKQRSAEVADNNVLQHLGPFGLPIDEKIMWGPDDNEVQNYHAAITSHLHSVANSLEPELDISRTSISDTKNPDTKLLVQMVLGLDDEWWLCPQIVDPARHRPKRRQLLRAILAAALVAWVFDTPRAPAVSYDSILLFHYQEEVLNKHNMGLLESLHRRAFIRMMEDTSPLQEFISGQAEVLADRCLEAVLPITAFGRRGPKPSTREWLASNPDASVRRDHIIQAFSFALRLMRWLPLTQQCFEFYAPAPGCVPAEGFVARPDDSNVGPNQVVKLCLMPGVVEYPPNLFLDKSSGPDGLCGGKNMVRASEDQRRFGRVICPAIITTVDKNDSLPSAPIISG